MPRILTDLSLGGDRARELAANAQKAAGMRSTNAAEYVPVTKYPNATATPSSTPVEAGATGGSESLLDVLLKNKLGQMGKTTEFSPFPNYVKSNQTPEQRAAALVAGKYNAQTSAVQRAQQQVAQRLAVDVNTQNQYGAIGDAKLQTIYGDLTNIAKDSATKTDALYANAKTGVDATYADAAKVQNNINVETQGNVASTAATFGLEAAVGEATKNLTAYQNGAESQLATDRAAGVSNIITLGANMGAAALKDVNIMAQLGADSRRDLISSVQGTIAQMQQQAAAMQADLQGQLLDLEKSRAADMQAATYQFEADEVDRASKYEIEKLKYEFENKKFEADTQAQNLKDILTIFEAQEKQLTGEAARSASTRAANLAENKFKHDIWKDNASVELDNKEFGLKVDKFKVDTVDTFADNDRQARKDAIDAKYDQQKLALDSMQFSSREARLAAEARIDNARADEKLALDRTKVENAAEKEARLIRESNEKNAAAKEKDRRDAEKGEVLLKKAKIDLEIAKQKLNGPTGSIKKYPPGRVGVNSYTADLNTGNKGEGTAIRAAFDSIEAAQGSKVFAGDSKQYDRVRAQIMNDFPDQDMREALLIMAAIQYNDYTTKAK